MFYLQLQANGFITPKNVGHCDFNLTINSRPPQRVSLAGGVNKPKVVRKLDSTNQKVSTRSKARGHTTRTGMCQGECSFSSSSSYWDSSLQRACENRVNISSYILTTDSETSDNEGGRTEKYKYQVMNIFKLNNMNNK